MAHVDSLMRFESREERDEMVERLNDCHDEIADGVCRAVTTREVAHRYNFADFRNGDRCREVSHIRTCSRKPFDEIYHRPGYTI